MAAVGSVDVELEVMVWLRARLDPDVVVRDETDNNLLNELPTVQVQRIPAGGDDGIRLDRAFIDIDVYAVTRTEAIALSATIRGLLLTELRGASTDAAVFTRVGTIGAPGVRPYENTALRRVGAVYEIYSHPVS
ncbi:hypothetical protein [Streptomyces sp. NPDC006355]|uniref:hypothetical protein n=1 Tax=Streptomyces sp. NPDC006355 TaxID=3156758 RepID=UPI0033A5FF32